MKTFKIGGAAFIIASALFLAGGNTYAEELSPVKEKIISEFQEETIDQEQEKLAKGEENLIYVQFKAGISATEKLAFERTFELKNKIDIGSAEIYQYRLPDQVVSEEVLVALNQSDIINFAEPEYKVTPSQEAIDLSGIWGFQNIEFPGIDANVSPAWNYTKGSPEVVVAVIDSGIDLNHPALKDRIWVNKDEIPGDGIDNDKNGYIDDENGWNFNQNNNDLMDTMGHGTHVSGIIAAGQQAINSSKINVSGLAPNVKIMPIRIFTTGESAGTTAAIRYAINNGALVTNMSFSSTGNSATREALMKEATNTIFASAAGNNGMNIDITPIYPAALRLSNNISVANMTNKGTLSSRSNYGIKNVDIAAPGSGIYNTFLNGGYMTYSGTSMAAPYVAGTAALIRSISPTLTPAEIKQIIESTVTPSLIFPNIIKSGGFLNTGKAVELAASNTIQGVFPEPALATEIARQVGKQVTDVFTPTDAEKITTITLKRATGEASKPASAEGIQRLKNLRTLDIRQFNLGTIDVSNNKLLETLTLEYDGLNNIDVSNNPDLKYFDVTGNNITAVNLRNQPNLLHCDIQNNKISSIDIHKNLDLVQFHATNNDLASVDVTANTALVNLAVGGNKLSTLNLSKLVNLKRLTISANKFSFIDVRNNPLLDYFSAGANQLTALDISRNPKLVYLDVNNNQIKELDISRNPVLTQLYTSYNPGIVIR